MKRIFAGILAVVLCLGMAGCSGNDKMDLTVKTDKGSIAIGMSREEVEKGLTFAKERSDGIIEYTEDISIYYRDGLVARYDFENSDISFFDGLHIGDAVDKIKLKPTHSNDNSMDFIFDKESGEYFEESPINDSMSDEDYKKYIICSFYIGDGEIGHYYVSDYLYAAKRK